MARRPAKIEVRCPHCGHAQVEPARVQSTYCRQCGEHIRITGELPPVAAPDVFPPAPSASPAADTAISATGSAGGGWFDQARRLFTQQGPRQVRCFECQTEQTVASAAKSTICPACSAYIDLVDIEIHSPYTRNIRTRGNVRIGPKGDLGATRTDCTDAVIEGRLRGDLLASGRVRVQTKQKIFGSIEADLLQVERRAEVECSRPLRCKRLEISGLLAASVTVEGPILIKKHGVLRGAARATSIQVEKGGVFDGTLAILPPPTPEPAQPSVALPAPPHLERPKPRQLPQLTGGWLAPVSV